MTTALHSLRLRVLPPFHSHYSEEIRREVAGLATLIEDEPALVASFPTGWLALKLLEGEADLMAQVAATPSGPAILAQAHMRAEHIRSIYGDTVDIALADARYGFIHGVALEVQKRIPTGRYDVTERIDRIAAHRVLGLPIFLAVMYIMFKLVVDVSAPFLDWVDAVITGPVSRWATQLLTLLAAPDWLHALVRDGIIAGVGGVLVFVPGLFVLYLFLTFLEDSGYMARVAFLMDKLMSFTGLHGKSFIPLILGFGCAVPAIYATRTLENERDRIATGLLVPLMSCSARLPVYVVFGMAFFPRHADLLILSLYLGGIVLAGGMAWLFSRTLFRNRPQTMFALELPPYRLPTFKGLLLHTWEKTKEFIQKPGPLSWPSRWCSGCS
jgi:ferrous iron transport protein B